MFSEVNFKVNNGELLIVTGPNGCGKSTLLSVLSGLKKPTAGKYTIHEEGHEVPLYLGAENNHLFLKRDAMFNLNFWSRMAGQETSEENVIQALKKWNLGHPFFRSKFPVQKFSTGMKRRLSLARLSILDRKVWLLDEPFFGLDTQAIDIFSEVLREHLNNDGLAVIVSHDLRNIKELPHQSYEFATKRTQK